MSIELRRGIAADAPMLGDICYRAFKTIAETHGFAPDFPSAEMAAGMMTGLIAHPGFFDMVAEDAGRLIGSNFLDERGPIGAVGPVSIDPAVQNDGAGRALMDAVLQRAAARGFAGVRLVQAGYHSRSLALYLKLGFEAREHLSCLQGPTPGAAPPGYTVRPATSDDLPACNALYVQAHGHERGGEVAAAVSQGTARVALRGGRVTGYASAIAFSGHAVGETNGDVAALIAAAEKIGGPGVLVPTRNGALVRGCLDAGLRITQTLTLMSIGLYTQPTGAWLPSVLY